MLVNFHAHSLVCSGSSTHHPVCALLSSPGPVIPGRPYTQIVLYQDQMTLLSPWGDCWLWVVHEQVDLVLNFDPVTPQSSAFLEGNRGIRFQLSVKGKQTVNVQMFSPLQYIQNHARKEHILSPSSGPHHQVANHLKGMKLKTGIHLFLFPSRLLAAINMLLFFLGSCSFHCIV